MRNIYIFTSNNKRGDEVFVTMGNNYTECELQAIQMNNELYGTMKLPGGSFEYPDGHVESQVKLIIDASQVKVSQEVKEYYRKKSAFIDSIIEAESGMVTIF